MRLEMHHESLVFPCVRSGGVRYRFSKLIAHRKDAGRRTSQSIEAQAIRAECQAWKLSKNLSWFAFFNGAGDEAAFEGKVAKIITLGLRPAVDNGTLWLVHGVGHGIAHAAIGSNIYYRSR
jgi:hypothetical protein